MKEITHITIDGKKAMCPHCKKTFKLRDKYFLPRHGFSFEQSGQYPQHERGNTQKGECRGSGMMADKSVVDLRLQYEFEREKKQCASCA
jgi:hypothetical protein